MSLSMKAAQARLPHCHADIRIELAAAERSQNQGRLHGEAPDVRACLG